jgi:DNA polymerase-3 subunit alpha
MESALKETYGIIVYQEQVMQIAKDLSGFTGGQADTLRKGIGKKNPEVIAKMKNEFIDGAIKTSDADSKFVHDLWKGLEDFAAYSFNKSHAACYALISVQTAYLKSHYPSAFMAALLTSDHENLERIAIEVAECRKMGIEVLPPDINESFMEFAVVPETENIRFGLGAVKNVGQGPIEKIIEARDDGGQFKSIEDFAQRVDATVVNKKVMESLVKCGAFDSMGDRDTLLFNVDKITSYASRVQKNALSGQIDIFGSLNLHEQVPSISMDKPNHKIDPRQHLIWEKELLGLYVSTHPLSDFKNYLQHKTNSIKDYKKSDDGKIITIGGIITSARKIYTKKNDPMAFAQLETLDGDVELIVFPRVYAKYEDLWVADNVLEIEGKINAKDRDGNSTDELKIFADKAKILNAETARMWLKPKAEPEASTTPKTDSEEAALSIDLESIGDTDTLMKIKQLLDNNPGKTIVTLTFKATNQKMRLPRGVNMDSSVLEDLKIVIGDKNITIKDTKPANI